ncbi:peptidase inhibitor family I36 protein [Dactylosporangium sp. NPDC048998]|uniref:peptidase inhibitor family I36 protein n=1 Tax=Dactylosporangium sp. NPDC048998 TaxID=3363976 RepID=UPI00371C7964
MATGFGVVHAAAPALAVTTRMTIGNGSGSCPLGYVCLWTLDNYTGTGYAFYNSETDYSTLPAPFNNIQDNSWSFYNNGQTSDITFYRDYGYGGDWFVVCKQTGIPSLPSNSTLPTWTNEPGRGWRDHVSSHRFGAYC